MPFWFLNDDLDEAEMGRQIADFHAHGIGGLVLHPRVGLPRSLGWMSDRLLHFLRVAIIQARRLGMSIILYDEGMYPSGSSCGQVVASNPDFACRVIDHVLLEEDQTFALPDGANIVARAPTRQGKTLVAFDRKAVSGIRGLHLIDHDQPRLLPRSEGRYVDPPEDRPPAGDLLNPLAMEKFIELVYDKYHRAFGEYFGNTIIAIFTDEPNVRGKSAERRRVMPGTTGILPHVNRILGYDFTPHLPALWYDDEPNASQHRGDWMTAIGVRLEETYYQPIRQWCDEHNIQLTGHPGGSDDISMERYFHIPGQDLVWRYVTPGNDSALCGAHSTMAKCASSAMVHLGRTRNANEIFGAYGHNLTYDEIHWLGNWALIRGQNMLIPHAFYYSTRGPRIDERPPDVGPNSAWWDRFKSWADHVSRICYLNSLGAQQCETAVLCGTRHLPDQLVRPLYENQIDFNYMMASDLLAQAHVNDEGIRIRQMHYRVLLTDGSVPTTGEVQPLIRRLEDAGRLIRWTPDQPADGLVRQLKAKTSTPIELSQPQPDLRLRHVICDNAHWLMLFNEGPHTINVNCTIGLPARTITVLDVHQQTAHAASHTLSLTIPSGLMRVIHCPCG